MTAPRRPPNAGVTTSRALFCDLRCPSADFARAEALDGSCRTFVSVWCGELRAARDQERALRGALRPPPPDDRVLTRWRRSCATGCR